MNETKNTRGQQKDPAKELALWAAIHALDRGNRRAAPAIGGAMQQGGPSWHERDARKILFLRHRYLRGEWQGAADRGVLPRPEYSQAALGDDMVEL